MSAKSRTEYSILNLITGLGGYIINTILGFVCRMMFVRYLSESYLGLNGLLSNIIGILSLAELGIGSAIIYALYKPIADDDREKVAAYIKIYRTAYYIIGVLVAILGICMIPFLKYVIKDTSGISENLYLIYGIYIFNTASGYFFSYRSNLLSAYQKNYIVVGTSYIITSLQSIIQMVLLIMCKSYMPYLIVQTVGTQLYNIIITIWTNKEYPFITNKINVSISKEEKRTLFNNIKAVIKYKISGIIVNNTDNLVITYFTGLGITGLASNYTLLVNTLDVLLKQVFSAITSSVGNLNATSSVNKQYEFFKVMNLANFWLYGWASIGVVIVSSDLVELFFGINYIMDFKIPIILAINLYMVGMQNAVWTYKNTTGLFKYGQYILLVTAFLNIVGDIILGKYFGVFGIFLATAIARGVTNTWYEPYAVFKVGFKKSPWEYFKKYLSYLVILFFAGSISFLVCSKIDTILGIQIIGKMFVCSIITNAIFYFCFRKKEEFNFILQIIVKICKFRIT